MSGRFEYGARFEILRSGIEQDVALYRGIITWPEDQKVEFAIRIPRQGDVECTCVGPTEGEPEAWMTAHFNALLKTVVNAAQRGGKWPRRLNVWKDSPT